MLTDINDQINYISQFVHELLISERSEILQMIYNYNKNIIKTTGDGSIIKYKNMPLNLISSIYNYVYSKMQIKEMDLANFSKKN